MKKILLFIASICTIAVNAQTCDIPLQVVISEESDMMSEQATNTLKNRLQRLTTNGDNVGGELNSQFAIAVRYDMVDKHIISGAPAKHVYNLSFTFYIYDVKSQKSFSSYSMDINGVGNNATKAYTNAIQQINPNNRELQQFAEQGKIKIIDYYDRNYQNIIKKAQSSATLRNYEEALADLLAIPECCKGYEIAMNEVKKVYQQYVNRQCDENLAQAQAAWMATYDREGANVASVYLSQIYPDAACYSQAQALVKEIKGKMKEEWNFKLRQWSDLVSIEKQRIASAREIAIEYARNQPREHINIIYR